MSGVRRHLRELAEGFRILRSREFWQAFGDYWSPEAISARLDELAARLRGESAASDRQRPGFVCIELVTSDGLRWEWDGMSLGMFETQLGVHKTLTVDPCGTRDSGWRVRCDKVVSYRVVETYA